MSEKKKILILITSSTLITLALCWDFFSHDHLQSDYLTFYSAIQTTESGNNPYIVENLINSSGNESVYPYLYTPFPLTVFSIFNSTDFILSQSIWAIFNILIFQLIIFLTYKFALNDTSVRNGNIRQNTINYFFYFSTLIMLFVLLAFRENIKIGQVNILTLLLIGLAIFFAGKNQGINTGIALAAAILIKASPALLIIPLVLKLKLKFIIGLLIGILIFFGISVLQFSIEPWQEYIRFLISVSGEWEIPGLFQYTVPFNNSLLSFSARIFGEGSTSYIINYLAIFLLVVIIIFRQRKIISIRPEDFLPWLALMVIASPLSYRHHSIYLYPAAVAMIFTLKSYKNIFRKYISISMILIFLAWCGYNFLKHYVPMIESGQDITYISGLGLYGYLAILVFSISGNEKNPVENQLR